MARIMIVEDEAIVAADLKQKLEGLNYQVVATVGRGKEAISTANKLKPDLILMDIVLKGKLNGIESAKQIQKNLDVPIIYVTAYADKKTLEQAKTTTPFGYIIKPFQSEHIRSTLEMALYKHQMDQKLKESEAWFKILFDFAPDAYYLSDSKGNFIDGNKATVKLLGYKKKEFAGKNFKDIGLLPSEYFPKAKKQKRLFGN
jgi:CheY-like chemotaxis protein